ncbi:MAG: hypothetical protein ACREA0_09195 [bacterium]
MAHICTVPVGIIHSHASISGEAVYPDGAIVPDEAVVDVILCYDFDEPVYQCGADGWSEWCTLGTLSELGASFGNELREIYATRDDYVE